MTDDQSGIDPGRKSWIDKIAQFFSDGPTDTKSLLELLHNAEQDKLLDADALRIIQGAIRLSGQQVKDIMIPRSQVVTVAADLNLQGVLQRVAGASHSRFPVVGEDVDNVMGILLAKDLLPVVLTDNREKFAIQDVLRPATFVTEDKPLNALLKEFQSTRQHMAIVINEYGSVSGVVTIENVLEEIVGEIEDEFDVSEDDPIRQYDEDNYVVKALTPVGKFNEYFRTEFSDQDFTTIGGLVLQEFGRIPKRSETAVIGPYLVTVLNADGRQIKLLKVTRNPAKVSPA